MKIKQWMMLSAVSLCIGVATLSTPAWADHHDKGTPTRVSDKKEVQKPIVAVIKAAWCPACKKIEPTVKGVMKDYKDKAQFVMLDVTDAKTTKEAEAMAKKLGIEAFFKKYQSKTSTVAIIDPLNKKVLHMFQAEGKREAYTQALDKLLKG